MLEANGRLLLVAAPLQPKPWGKEGGKEVGESQEGRRPCSGTGSCGAHRHQGRLTVAPEGHQQRRDVCERGGQQQKHCGLGAEPRAVAALDRLREELVERHEGNTESIHPLSDPLADGEG